MSLCDGNEDRYMKDVISVCPASYAGPSHRRVSPSPAGRSDGGDDKEVRSAVTVNKTHAAQQDKHETPSKTSIVR